MREKQILDTCWGVKIYYPHGLCAKKKNTLFLICLILQWHLLNSEPRWHLKQWWHTSCTPECLPWWRVGERERANKNQHYGHTHTQTETQTQTHTNTHPHTRHICGQGKKTFIHDFIHPWIRVCLVLWINMVSQICLISSVQMNDCKNLKACLIMHYKSL